MLQETVPIQKCSKTVESIRRCLASPYTFRASIKCFLQSKKILVHITSARFLFTFGRIFCNYGSFSATSDLFPVNLQSIYGNFLLISGRFRLKIFSQISGHYRLISGRNVKNKVYLQKCQTLNRQ